MVNKKSWYGVKQVNSKESTRKKGYLIQKNKASRVSGVRP